MKSPLLLVLAGVLATAISHAQTPRPGATVDPTEAIPTFDPVEFRDGVVTFQHVRAAGEERRGARRSGHGDREGVPSHDAGTPGACGARASRGCGPTATPTSTWWTALRPSTRRTPASRSGRAATTTASSCPGIAEFYADTPVPHGKVEINFYPSAILKETRHLWIYTPPGYATSGQQYPVLYLLHGSGDLEGAWVEEGRANFILDNLIAAGTSQADDRRDAARARAGECADRPGEEQRGAAAGALQGDRSLRGRALPHAR